MLLIDFDIILVKINKNFNSNVPVLLINFDIILVKMDRNLMVMCLCYRLILI